MSVLHHWEAYREKQENQQEEGEGWYEEEAREKTKVQKTAHS
jgi:hypothetical protein